MAYGFSDEFNITGLVELQTKLAAFGDKVVNVITQKALIEGARIIQKEAIAKAPKWDGKEHNLKVGGVYIKIQPGNLKRNIKVRRVKRPEKGYKSAQVYVKMKQTWYAKWVEGQENGNSRQAAVPFMRPAFESKQDEAITVFETYVKDAIVGGKL